MISDNELIQQIKEGHQTAYTRLLSRHKDSVYFRLLKMVGVNDDAEDLMIETFDRAFCNIHTYDNHYAFSTWLHTIANNVCIDFIRNRKRNFISIDSLHNEEGIISEKVLDPSYRNPEEDMISEQQTTLWISLVSELPPKYRELIELRYFKEYAYEEIADLLGVPVGTVKTRLFRAKAALGELLAEHAIHHKSLL